MGPDLLTVLDRTYAVTAPAVDAIADGDLTRSTPCSEWDVAAVLRHLVGSIGGLASAAARTAPGAPPSTASAADARAAYHAAVEASRAAWSAPGALEGNVLLPVGAEVPAAAAIGINVFDVLVHGWDLDRALGRSTQRPDDLAEVAIGFARMVVAPEMRTVVGFAAEVEVPADAPAIDRLVAFLGRRP